MKVKKGRERNGDLCGGFLLGHGLPVVGLFVLKRFIALSAFGV